MVKYVSQFLYNASERGLTKLHVDSVQYDYPLGLSKAFANKVLCSWAAHFLADSWL